MADRSGIDEQSLTPEDVYIGVGKGGQLTPLGIELAKQNPVLLDWLVRHAQYNLSAKFPSLYPQTVKPAPVPENIRRVPKSNVHKPEPRLSDEQIGKLFAPGGDVGECNRLARLNPQLYSASRERAVDLGYVRARRRHPTEI